jgi:hypothetical protein
MATLTAEEHLQQDRIQSLNLKESFVIRPMLISLVMTLLLLIRPHKRLYESK